MVNQDLFIFDKKPDELIINGLTEPKKDILLALWTLQNHYNEILKVATRNINGIYKVYVETK